MYNEEKMKIAIDLAKQGIDLEEVERNAKNWGGYIENNKTRK